MGEIGPKLSRIYVAVNKYVDVDTDTNIICETY